VEGKGVSMKLLSVLIFVIVALPFAAFAQDKQTNWELRALKLERLVYQKDIRFLSIQIAETEEKIREKFGLMWVEDRGWVPVPPEQKIPPKLEPPSE
jgi:hypothetical protein